MALLRHVEVRGDSGLDLWRSSDGCGTFVMRDIVIEPADSRVKIAGKASGSAGVLFFGLCWGNVSWTGSAEIMARPELDTDWQLQLRDLDIHLYDRSGQKAGLAARLFGLVKRWSEAQVSTFTFDLSVPITELSTLMKGIVGPASTTPVAMALDTIRPVGLTVEPGAIKVAAAFDVPSGPLVPRAPETALTPAQLRLWQARLDDWDGFPSLSRTSPEKTSTPPFAMTC
jgi:hypothetical protein